MCWKLVQCNTGKNTIAAMEKSVESGYANIAAIEKYYRNGYFAVLLWTKIAAIEKSAESGYEV